MYNNGFTLIEMLIVLLIISICVLVFPVVQQRKQLMFRYQMLTFKQHLLQAQTKAMETRKIVNVDIQANGYQIDDVYYAWDNMSCQRTSLQYYPQGSVSQAKTIHCSCERNDLQLVIQLGSGQMDVR